MRLALLNKLRCRISGRWPLVKCYLEHSNKTEWWRDNTINRNKTTQLSTKRTRKTAVCWYTCASLSPSSIRSRLWRMMPHFSWSTLLLSDARLSSGGCRLSSRLRFSPRSASKPEITCCVLHRISSADNIAEARGFPFTNKLTWKHTREQHSY